MLGSSPAAFVVPAGQAAHALLLTAVAAAALGAVPPLHAAPIDAPSGDHERGELGEQHAALARVAQGHSGLCRALRGSSGGCRGLPSPQGFRELSL